MVCTGVVCTSKALCVCTITVGGVILSSQDGVVEVGNNFTTDTLLP